MATLSARYRDICLDVFCFGYLTVHHVMAHFATVKEQFRQREANRTLAAMERKRLIRRFAQPTFHGERGGSAPKVVALDEVGAYLVSEELGIELARIHWKPTPSEFNFWFLTHALEIADYACAVRQAQTGVVSWVGETELKRAPVQVGVPVQASGNDKGGTQEKTVSLVPDGLYSVETAARRAHFLLELDRGTVTINSQSPLQRRAIVQKIAAYHEFATSGLYKEAFQMGAPPRITWVTTSEKRLQSLMQAVADTIDGPPRVLHWFTTQELVTPSTVLTQPIWQVVGRQGKHVLIKDD